MFGTYAVYSSSEHPTIYLNQKWIEYLSVDQISKLILEETGHYLDSKINGLYDTKGDEGELFANLILGIEIGKDNLERIFTENDKLNLFLDGQKVEVEMASLLFGAQAYFAQASTGTPANTADLESNTLLLLNPLPGNRVLFVSDPPGAPFYSGNNVRGTLYAVDASNNIVGSWFGEISRLFKVGSTAVACQMYIYSNPNNSSLTDVPSTTIFIDFYAATPNFSSGQIVKTSSDPIAAALNKMLPVNVAPVANADVATAVEAGGLNNAIAGIPATGNITSNDTDVNTSYVVDLVLMKLFEVPDPLSLTKISCNFNGQSTTFSSSITTSNLVGKYGSLSTNLQGNFTYTVNENHPEVQALRLTNNTVSETFTYTITDGKGGFSTGVLTANISGKNDSPIAFDNYDYAKESIEALVANQYTSSDPRGQRAIGNVLPNDTDVDQYGEVKTILGVTATAVATTISQSTTLQFSSLPSNVSVGRFVWMDGDGVVNQNSNGYVLKNNNNQDITVVSVCSTCTPATATLSSVPYLNGQIQLLPAGTILGFSNNIAGASYQESTITGSVFTPSTLLQINSVGTGQISAGMTVSGTGVPAGTLVNSISYTAGGQINQLTLSQPIAVSNATLTFSSSAGATLTGQYGVLVLQENGSYVYTPFANNPNLNSGDVVVDAFLYTMRDIHADTSTATLYIQVMGSGPSDPNTVDDLIQATEAGGLNNATAGLNPSGSLFVNCKSSAKSVLI